MVCAGAAGDYSGATRGWIVFPERCASPPDRSVSVSPLRWRRGRGPGRLAAQVGAGDDAGQDAQPRLHLRSLLVVVLWGRSPWGLPAAGPGVPARPRRSVLSRLVSHILSLMACDRVSASSWGIAIRIISFTSYRFGSAACSPTPLVSVAAVVALENYLRGLPALITPTGPSASGLSHAVLGVYRRLSFGTQPPRGRFKAETVGNRPLQDGTSEQLELRAGSGLAAGNPTDVGVRDGA